LQQRAREFFTVRHHVEIKNKKAVIVGLGETGYDTAFFLLKKGARVFITESGENESIREKAFLLSGMGANVQTGEHTEKFIQGAEIIIPSPGIPETSIPLAFAKKNRIPVISEIELGYIFSPSRKIIAVTGTDGKTTTTSILGLMFRNAKLPSIVCGNIGNSFIGEMENTGKDTFIILEASSFQLEKTKTFKPFIGCLLNIDEDHLDRHLSFQNYMEAKKKLFANQDERDAAVINYDDVYCRKAARNLCSEIFFFSQNGMPDRGAYLKRGKIISNVGGRKNVFETEKIAISGKGNNENIMAALIIGLICKIDTETLQKSLCEFAPLPHRFEKVKERKGIVFINDSKATNPHSVMNALRSIDKGRKAILIMGGQNKQVSFIKLVPLIKEKVKLLLLLGEASETIAEEVKNAGVPHIFVRDMKEAVEKGAKNASKGDTVLLSPGCASFDMFENYKERGNVFKKEVELLS